MWARRLLHDRRNLVRRREEHQRFVGGHGGDDIHEVEGLGLQHSRRVAVPARHAEGLCGSPPSLIAVADRNQFDVL